MADRTSDGRAFRMLTIIDEYTRECLSIDVARRLSSEDVLERLSDLFIRRGVPRYLRSRPTPTQAALVCPVGAHGPEFVAKEVHKWLDQADVQTLFIAKGSLWENGPLRERLRGELQRQVS